MPVSPASSPCRGCSTPGPRHPWTTRSTACSASVRISRSTGSAVARTASRRESPHCQNKMGAFASARGLYVVVQRELVRVRPDLDRHDLVLALHADPRLDEVGRENPTLGEIFVVGLEAV